MGRHAVLVATILLTLNTGAAEKTALQQCRTALVFFDSGGSTPKTATALTDATWCFGYVSAVMDMNMWLRANGSESAPCLPDNSTPEQAVRVFVRYANDHPEHMHHPPAVLVTRALLAAFPCPNASAEP
jgi:hypothetical protein